jgi:hypothetical protein
MQDGAQANHRSGRRQIIIRTQCHPHTGRHCRGSKPGDGQIAQHDPGPFLKVIDFEHPAGDRYRADFTSQDRRHDGQGANLGCRKPQAYRDDNAAHRHTDGLAAQGKRQNASAGEGDPPDRKCRFGRQTKIENDSASEGDRQPQHPSFPLIGQISADQGDKASQKARGKLPRRRPVVVWDKVVKNSISQCCTALDAKQRPSMLRMDRTISLVGAAARKRVMCGKLPRPKLQAWLEGTIFMRRQVPNRRKNGQFGQPRRYFETLKRFPALQMFHHRATPDALRCQHRPVALFSPDV